MKRLFSSTLTVALAMMAVVATERLAFADAADFLSAFSGEWRGTGQARKNVKSDLTAVRCSLAANFAANALNTSGKCGTTQGTRSLDGRMTASGNTVSGNLFSKLDDGQMISYSSQLKGGTLVSSATYRTVNGGKLVRMRTSLRKPSGGKFVVHSQLYDDGAQRWVVSADITFTKK